MQKRSLRVSLVIPAFNEEDHLGACLDAIAAQSVSPFEVIVVDNNSSDATAAIAASYPFVRVIREMHQGLVFARDAGFDAARGDIIGRIDADTHLPVDWIATVQRLFAAKAAPHALSGSVGYYDIPLKQVVARFDLAFRQYIAKRLGRETYLFGANMAIRRDVWQAVRSDMCHARHLHEDFDLAVHLAEAGKYDVRFEPALFAAVSARCIDYTPRAFYAYALANPRTYAAHGLRSQRCMYGLIIFLIVMYLPLKLAYRMSDNAGRISAKNPLRPSYPAHASPLAE